MVKTTITVQQEDLDLVRNGVTYFPGASDSLLIRAALREGVPKVLADPAKLWAPPVTLKPAPAQPFRHVEPMEQTPGQATMANAMRPAVPNPEGKGGRKKGDPHRRKGQKAPGPSLAGPDTPGEKRARAKP